METNKKYIFIIAGLILLVIILSVIYYSLRKNITPNGTNPTPTNLYTSPSIVPLNSFDYTLGKPIEQVPTLKPDQGYGLNLNSPEVQNSIKELDKINSDLPYSKEFTTTQNIDVKIVIPTRELMENEWTLTAHVYGIDFQVPEGDPQYELMRRSFLETAQDMYFWLKNQGVNTENTIIKWGDKAYVQERAELWLR